MARSLADFLVCYGQSTQADRCSCLIYDAAGHVDELHNECDELAATLCQYRARARALAGIAARVRTLLSLSPEVFKPSDTEA